MANVHRNKIGLNRSLVLVHLITYTIVHKDGDTVILAVILVIGNNNAKYNITLYSYEIHV